MTSNQQHPGERWQRDALAAGAQREGRDRQTGLRLAAMAGHIKEDLVAARRAALVDVLADGRPHLREALWEAVAAQLDRDCWGERPEEALWRDLKALRAGGLRIAYSRRPGIEGYYLAFPPLERGRSHAQQRIDSTHLAGIREMTIAQKNRQAFAAAAFALQQKRLLLAREHPERHSEEVDAAARRLVYGRHEVP